MKPEPPRNLGTKADAGLDAFFAATGAKMETSTEPRAYYDIARDRIHMPPIETFHDAARYYGVQGHELVHWTGAIKRLDRLGRFADRKAYAFEELVAEIGTCMLGAHIGVEPDFGQSAAYVEGWQAALKEDSRAIFRAASEAQKSRRLYSDARRNTFGKSRLTPLPRPKTGWEISLMILPSPQRRYIRCVRVRGSGGCPNPGDPSRLFVALVAQKSRGHARSGAFILNCDPEAGKGESNERYSTL